MKEWVTTCNNPPDWLEREELESPQRWGLTLIWSADEPHRIGETAFVDAAAGELILGRGDATVADPRERLHFVHHRPAGTQWTSALAGRGLSRQQCIVQATATGIFVKNVGRARLFVDGRAHQAGIVALGQVIHVENQLSLYCSLKESSPRSRYFDDQLAAGFGVADELGIVGEHRVIWELRDRIAFAAASANHVLLLGESGTGKELVARAIHRLSERRDKPMISRNAATLVAEHIDAELFGNAADFPRPGVPERPGVIGAVNGSTLFLDEIAELRPELQAHLLRVLDHGGEYQRLGDSQVRQSDFRLVMATNRDPTELRSDILGRLTLQIQLPSLDDHREDIPLLVRHLLQRAAESVPGLRTRFFDESEGSSEPRIHPDLMETLIRHQYPLNVRELERLLWKAVSESAKNFVALTRSIRQEFRPCSPLKTPTTGPGHEPGVQDILLVLQQQQGSVAKAADALGMKSRYALYRLMRRYGISVERASPEQESE